MPEILDKFEFWELPLLVAGIILLGHVIYVGIAKWAPRIVTLRIKIGGHAFLAALFLVLSYLLVRFETVFTVTGAICLAIEVYLLWATRKEYKEYQEYKNTKADREDKG